MNLTISFRHMETSDALKEYIESKMEKVQKFYSKPLNITVVLSVEKLDHTADVSVNSKGLSLKFVEKTKDLYASIDGVVDKIERNIKRENEKVHGHHSTESIRTTPSPM